MAGGGPSCSPRTQGISEIPFEVASLPQASKQEGELRRKQHPPIPASSRVLTSSSWVQALQQSRGSQHSLGGFILMGPLGREAGLPPPPVIPSKGRDSQ